MVVQSHPQLGIGFALAPSFHSFGVISPLITSSILGTYWPREFLFLYPIILPFHTVHGILKARILKWFAIPFSTGLHSVRCLHHDPSILGGPTQHGLVSLSQTRLWSVWSDWLVFCESGFSVSALWCPVTTPTVLLWFLLPWPWGIFLQLLQQSTAAAPYLGRGRPSWPWTWNSSSWLPPLTSDVG